MNVQILANNIVEELPVSLNVVSLQYLEQVIGKYTSSSIVAQELRDILYTRKAKAVEEHRVKTYAQYIGRGQQIQV